MQEVRDDSSPRKMGALLSQRLLTSAAQTRLNIPPPESQGQLSSSMTRLLAVRRMGGGLKVEGCDIPPRWTKIEKGAKKQESL